MKEVEKIYVELDRSKAIAYAIQTAAEGDVVIVAGKGHEDYQIIGTQKFHFSDAECVQEHLKHRFPNG